MPEPVIKFTRGVPPPECFPFDQIAECSNSILDRDYERVLQYGSAGGYPPLRSWLAGQYQSDENRVAVGQGSLQLLDTIARIILKPGSLVYIEAPSYDRALTVFRRAGADVIGIPLRSDGLDVEMVETRLKAGEHPALFYIIPDFQNPSGMELSLEKRKYMAELAGKYGFCIIEDSPYRKLRYRGLDIPTIHELAPEQVIYMSSFSKLISPGLRVGYSIMPEALAPKFIKFSEDTYVNPSLFNQGIVFEYIHRGWLEPNINKLKTLYQPRLDIMLQTLEQEFKEMADWYKPDGGFFVGTTLKLEMDVDTLLETSKASGILLSDGRGFFAQKPQQCFIRLPFCALTPPEIKVGVIRLAKIIRNIEKQNS